MEYVLGAVSLMTMAGVYSRQLALVQAVAPYDTARRGAVRWRSSAFFTSTVQLASGARP